MGRAIAIFNQKGGVGKTTTNVNLSASLAKLNKKILVIDNDPQGNTTSGFGMKNAEISYNLFDALVDDIDPHKCIIKNAYDNLDLIPSDVNLAGAEIHMVKYTQREYRLKRVVDELKDEYDYIFMDCPPSLGLLTINSLVAADSVLIPIQCEYYALEGVSQLMNTYQLVKKGLNRKLEIEGVLLSMFDGRTNLSIQVVDEVKKYFKGKVYTTLIPKNVRLAEAPSYGIPAIDYDSTSKGAIAYMELAEEILYLEDDNGEI